LFIQRSTGNVGIGNNLTPTSTLDVTGTLAVSGNATFDTNTLFVDAANNRVGIGTTSPASILQLERSSDSGSASTFPSLQVKNTLATQGDGSSTFNFSNLNLSSGDGVVNMFLLTTYAAGTWAPSAQLSVSSNHPLVFKTNNTERMRILEGGNVGIGTSAPNTTLSVVTSGVQSTISPIVTAQTSTVTYGGLYAVRDGAGDQRGLVLQTYEANVGLVEKVRITSAGNVGIGTSAPDTKLQVAGTGATGFSIRANTSGDAFMRYYLDAVIASDAYVDRSTGNLNIRSNQNGSSIVFSTSAALVERFRITDNGVTFNGDTAAANALDDYEEGTWTMGIAFGGASAGVTYSVNTGTYTKIGRQVTVNGYLFLTSKGSSTGVARITGLPFTVANTNGNLSSASLFFQNITFANQFQGYAISNTQQISLEEITEAGADSTITEADFANNSGIIVNLTYFV
jgi:hypothetical protein